VSCTDSAFLQIFMSKIEIEIFSQILFYFIYQKIILPRTTLAVRFLAKRVWISFIFEKLFCFFASIHSKCAVSFGKSGKKSL